jgi:hypothetical protein
MMFVWLQQPLLAIGGERQLLKSTLATNEQRDGGEAKRMKLDAEPNLGNNIGGVAAYGCPEKFCEFRASKKSTVLGHLRTVHKIKKAQMKRTIIKPLTRVAMLNENWSAGLQQATAVMHSGVAVPFNNYRAPSPTTTEGINEFVFGEGERESVPVATESRAPSARTEGIKLNNTSENQIENWDGDCHPSFSLEPVKIELNNQEKISKTVDFAVEREVVRESSSKRLRDWYLRQAAGKSVTTRALVVAETSVAVATSAAVADCLVVAANEIAEVAVVGDAEDMRPRVHQVVMGQSVGAMQYRLQPSAAAASDMEPAWPAGIRGQASGSEKFEEIKIVRPQVPGDWDELYPEEESHFFRKSEKDPYIDYTNAVVKNRVPKIKDVIKSFYEIRRKRPREPVWAVVRQLVDESVPTAKMFVWTIAHTLSSSGAASAEVDESLEMGKGKCSMGSQTESMDTEFLQNKGSKKLTPPPNVMMGMGQINPDESGDAAVNEVNMEIDEELEKRLLQD